MNTALVLSGGGARGDFQVGAIRYLYDHALWPNIICGASVGAINAVKLAEGGDYRDEGVACYVYDTPVGGASSALFRLYHPISGDHFYTTSLAERDNAIANLGYTSEGIAC